MTTLGKIIVLAVIIWFSKFEILYSQELVFEHAIDHNKLGELKGVKIGDYFFISGLSADGVYSLFILNDMEDLFYSYQLKRGYLELCGYTESSSELIFFLRTNTFSTDRMECLTFSKVSKRFVKLNDVGGVSHKNVLSDFTAHNKFYSLSLDKKTSSLILVAHRRDSAKVISKFYFKDEEVFESLLFRKDSFTKEAKTFNYIAKSSEVSFSRASRQEKLYFNNGRVTLIVDSWKGGALAELLSLELDTLTNSVLTRKLALPFDDKTEHNSFLFNNQLIVLGIDRVHLAMVIYNFETLNKVIDHRVMRGERIPFKGSNLISDGVDYDEYWKKTINEKSVPTYTHQKLNEGIPVVAVSNGDESHYRLLMGSCKRTGGGSGVTFYQSAGATASGAPSFTHVGGGPETVTNTFFYGYLTKPNWHLADSISFSSHGNYDLVDRRRQKLSETIKLGGVGVINSFDSLYLIYINKKTKMLVMEKFSFTYSANQW